MPSVPVSRVSWLLLVAACGSSASDRTDRPPGGEPPLAGCTCGDGELCVEGACVACAPAAEVAHAVAGVPVLVPLDPVDGPFAERVFRMRPVEVSGVAELAFDGDAVEVLDAAGASLPAGTRLEEPGTIYLRGKRHGDATVRLEPVEGCAASPVEIAAQVRPAPDLAGRALSGAPHFEPERAHNPGEAVQVAVDPGRHAERIGLPYDVYVVAHRTPSAWAADPTLVDLGDGASGTVVAGSIADNVVEAWAAPVAGPEVTTGYDVVLDFGGDGRLDPGDLIDGFDEPGISTVIDLVSPGPHPTTSFPYSASFWNTMVVYAPDPPTGDHPLVVISHGNGHEYTWYDYLGIHLASWGYVVISHRNDTVPGVFTAATTTFTNTETFLRDLPTLGGGVLDGKVDRSRITWIGHSRGGEGVVIAYDKIRDGAVVPTQFTAADIALVSSIAPTLFEGPDVTDPNDVPYHLLAGSSDGDVTGGVDCDLCQYFRIFQRGTGDHQVTYVQGATHNDFNCCGINDAIWTSGSGQKIGRARAQDVAKSYYLALLEHYVRGDTVLEDYLARLPEGFRPPSAAAIVATQYKRGEAAPKLVIDDFQTEPGLEVSSSGGGVSFTVENLVEAPLDDGDSALAWSPGDPMNGMSQAHGDPDPARGVVFDFPEGSDLSLAFEVPVGAHDVSVYGALSFRACQGTRHPYTEALDDLLSFTATLVDGAGVERSVDFGVYGRLPEPYERTDGTGGSGWVNEFQTVRIPLAAFTVDGSGLDLTDIRTVRFDFGAAHGSPQGRVGLDDIEFVE